MDSQGFVPLQVLIQFNRLAAIAHDIHTLQIALIGSTELELLSSSERGPLVRARQDPTKWVYPLSERDEIAKHPGPAPSYFQAQQAIDRQMQEYQQYSYPQPYFFDPQYGFPSASFRPQDQDGPPPQVDLDQSSQSPVSAQFDPQNRKLSGDASIFVPNGVNFTPPITNGDMGTYDLQSLNTAISTVDEEPEDVIFEEDNFTNIILTINDPKNRPIIPALPVNGVHHKSVPENAEPALRSPLQGLTWRFSDATAATQASNSMSVNSGLSSLTVHDDLPQKSKTAETALTEKNLKKQLSQSGTTEYTYPEFHKSAIQARESSQKVKKESTEMSHLYQFWADFLRGYWTSSMYSEFTRYAIEDANQGRRTGLTRLFNMYESALLNKFRISLWSDFVRLAGEDYRNGYLGGIEAVWRIRGILASKGRAVPITDGDVLRLLDIEIQRPSDLERLRREVKPAGVVLVPYTNVPFFLRPT
jgi:la-related protein 1